MQLRASLTNVLDRWLELNSSAPVREARPVDRDEVKAIPAWTPNRVDPPQCMDLTYRDFTGSDLRGKDLRGSNFSGSTVRNVPFRGANLENSNLSEAVGLLADQLGDTNLRQALLPTGLDFTQLERVNDLSKICGSLMLSMLAACSYSWLTVGSTRDSALLLNTSTSQLPIISTSVPIVGFYWIAPILLLGIYIYFHLYLQRLWEAMASLPGIFPDGLALDSKTQPWLMNDLVRLHFDQLRPRYPPLAWFQAKLSLLIGWWLIPMTLLVFWGDYLKRHDWFGTALQIATFGVAIWVFLTTRKLTRATLRCQEADLKAWKSPWRSPEFYLHGLAACGATLVFFIASWGGINGATIYRQEDTPRNSFAPDYAGYDPRSWVPRVFDFVNSSAYANMDEVDVSTKLNGWTDDVNPLSDLPYRMDLAVGARLRNAHLNACRARAAFLVKADLRDTDLRYAFLYWAKMQDAKLYRAQLSGATLTKAQLQYADFYDADLSSAYLATADMSNAGLHHVNLSGADLSYAVLKGAILDGADLSGAKLTNTDLRGVDLSTVKNLSARQIAEAICDAKTQFPSYIQRPVEK